MSRSFPFVFVVIFLISACAEDKISAPPLPDVGSSDLPAADIDAMVTDSDGHQDLPADTDANTLPVDQGFETTLDAAIPDTTRDMTDDILADLGPATWKFANVTPKPTGTFYGLHGSAANDVWAVGKDGSIYRYTGVWAPIDIHTHNCASQQTSIEFYGVWAHSSTNVWLVGKATASGASDPVGIICHYDGTDINYQALPAGHSEELFGLWGIDPSNIWAVGQKGLILRHDQNKWQVDSQHVDQKALLGVHGSSVSDVWAVGWDGTMRYYDGTSWRDDRGFDFSASGATAIPALRGVWAVSPTTAWAYGDDSTVLRWATSQWYLVPQVPHMFPPPAILGMWRAGQSDLWFVGEMGTIWHWLTQSLDASHSITGGGNIRAVWGSSPNDIWAVGSGGVILRYDN